MNRKPQTVSKVQSRLPVARNNSALLCRLFIACQIRKRDLDEFFRHENQAFPPALCDAGRGEATGGFAGLDPPLDFKVTHEICAKPMRKF